MQVPTCIVSNTLKIFISRESRPRSICDLPEKDHHQSHGIVVVVGGQVEVDLCQAEAIKANYSGALLIVPGVAGIYDDDLHERNPDDDEERSSK